MTIHSRSFELTRGGESIGIEVEFSLSGGSPGCAPSLSYPGDPPEPPEIEFESIVDAAGVMVELTAAEEERVCAEIYENLGDYDDGDDYDYPEYDD